MSRDGTELEPAVGQRLLDEWENLASEPIPSPAAETPAAKDAPSPAPKRTTPAAREPRRRDAGAEGEAGPREALVRGGLLRCRRARDGILVAMGDGARTESQRREGASKPVVL